MTAQVEKEPEWVRLEDLDPEDIDDEFGDMIIEQRLQVNNTVNKRYNLFFLSTTYFFFFFFHINRTRWNESRTILN